MTNWKWPDARGWIGIGSFVLTVMVLALLAWNRELREDEFFKAIATLIIGGFIKDVLGWAYQATKQGGELADANAAIVKESASAGVAAAGVVAAQAAANLPDPGKPTEVKVVNPPDDPANVTETHATSGDAGLPESLR